MLLRLVLFWTALISFTNIAAATETVSKATYKDGAIQFIKTDALISIRLDSSQDSSSNLLCTFLTLDRATEMLKILKAGKEEYRVWSIIESFSLAAPSYSPSSTPYNTLFNGSAELIENLERVQKGTVGELNGSSKDMSVQTFLEIIQNTLMQMFPNNKIPTC